MANDSESKGFSPLWYAVGALILVVLTMAAVLTLKPLEFKPVAAAHCEDAACGHDGAGPEGVSHAAAPPAGEPEGTSHESAPPPHPE